MSAVVLLSGGQDSTTCLAWARQLLPPDPIRALFVDYGQRHLRREYDAAFAVAHTLGAHFEQVRLDLSRTVLSAVSALTSDADVAASGGIDNLPTTYVPGRNLVFLALAAGLAQAQKIENVVIGCSSVDSSGYPDCRPEAVLAMERALRFGLAFPDLRIYAPLLHKSKAETVRMARELDAWEALGLSWTCYQGRERPCGTCPACELRARGFAEAGEEDPAR